MNSTADRQLRNKYLSDSILNLLLNKQFVNGVIMSGKKGLRNAAHGESSYETRIQVPVTSEQKAHYVNYAQSNGYKLAALIRKLLDDQIKTDRKLK